MVDLVDVRIVHWQVSGSSWVSGEGLACMKQSLVVEEVCCNHLACEESRG